MALFFTEEEVESLLTVTDAVAQVEPRSAYWGRGRLRIVPAPACGWPKMDKSAREV